MFLEVEQLGKVRLIENSRARRVIIRFRNGEFQLTHPPKMQMTEIEKLLIQKADKLLTLKSNSVSGIAFSEKTRFSTHTFDVVILKHTLNKTYATLRDGILQIAFPMSKDLVDLDTQEYIKNVIEAACRSEAKRVLPQRVKELAYLHGFTVGDVKINKSRSRWGSCSIQKNINLSYFCMMLPVELIDLIILHELCHTREMNHGERFWDLLDKVTAGKSKELTRQLKNFRLNW